MPTVKTCPDHPSSMEQRIADRLKPSAGDGAGDVQTTTGGSTAPNRVVHTIHLSGSAGRHGKADAGR
jgi:hypothetical protein